MDELKVRSWFFSSILSKWISSVVKKRYGNNIDIAITELTVNYDPETDKILVHADLGGSLDSTTFKRIIFSKEEF